MNLADNRICDYGMVALTDVLAESSIQRLDLSSYVPPIPVSPSPPQNNTAYWLQVLSIHIPDNAVTLYGAMQIEDIIDGTLLTHLDLSGFLEIIHTLEFVLKMTNSRLFQEILSTIEHS